MLPLFLPQHSEYCQSLNLPTNQPSAQRFEHSDSYVQCGSEELQLRVAWSLQDADVPQCLAGAARLTVEGNTRQCRDRVLMCRGGLGSTVPHIEPVGSQGTSDT